MANSNTNAASVRCAHHGARSLPMLIFIAALLLLSRQAFAQKLPGALIRIVTVEAGGGADFNARMVQQGITEGIAANVIVDSRRNVIIAGQFVAKAIPDATTLISVGSSFWLLPYLQKDVPFDPVKDFSPVSMTNRAPNVLVVHPSLPVKSVKELVAYAKAKPGELNYGTGASGASSHLAPEMFKAMTGTNMVRIPFKGGGPAMNALLAGEVHLMFSAAGSVTPYLKSGKLKPLGVASLKPSPLFPGLPTISASGVPGYESGSQQGVFAPANTPRPVINELNRAIVIFLEKPETRQQFIVRGLEPVGDSPQQFADFIKAQMATWGKLIKERGLLSEQ